MSFSRCLITSALLHWLYYHYNVIGLEYLNLAMHYKRNVEHSSTFQSEYSNEAEQVVDGIIDQEYTYTSGTTTNIDDPIWWRVQFTERVYIERIVIYPSNQRRTVLSRFQGSMVYISENGDCGGNLVYTQTADPTYPWQDIFDIPVNADGTYVVICNILQYMFLSEVQVIGCPYGRYGDQCSLTCGNCHLSTCHLANGSCPGDCENEYMGPICNTSCIGRCRDSNCTMDGCTDCDDGKHGVYCDRQCPLNCEGGTCSRHGGACIGCKQYKYWGEKCSNLCPLNCNDEMCAQENGVCHGCTDSFWGTWCNKTCPKNCHYGICSRTDGYCINGCISKYRGRQCEHDCPINCKNGECTQNNGLCADECEPGYHGDVCDGQCGRCIADLCDQYTGVCDGDCGPDYWGNHCNYTCPVNCFASVCTKDTGICGKGCSAGYRGCNCNEKCETGTYGFGCSYKCGNCFDGDVSCFHINGKCIGGCIAPFIGHSCHSAAGVSEERKYELSTKQTPSLSSHTPNVQEQIHDISMVIMISIGIAGLVFIILIIAVSVVCWKTFKYYQNHKQTNNTNSCDVVYIKDDDSCYARISSVSTINLSDSVNQPRPYPGVSNTPVDEHERENTDYECIS